MKNKKGFTLVELLAVIAILSLLVIIALPNVVQMYKDAKEQSFINECKLILKTAQSQWMNDSMVVTDDQTYSRCDSCTGKTLSLSGRQEVQYIVSLNKAGKVVLFHATDGTYQYVYDGDELLITDIVSATEVAGLAEDAVLKITSPLNGEIYIAYDGYLKIGEPIPAGVTYYTSYPDFLNASSRPIFLKHKVVNNIVKESYLGVRYNGNVYYIHGGDSKVSHASRVSQLRGIYNNSGCHDETEFSTGEIYGHRCINPDPQTSRKIDVGVYNDNRVIGYEVYGCYVGCYIDADGSSYCDPLNIVC